MKLNWSLPAAAILLTFLNSGCLFEPYYPTRVFDFPAPEQPIGGNLLATEFLNDSSADFRMQSKNSDGEVRIRPYCRWVLPPGALVSRGLNAQFRAETHPRIVTGSIRQFEVDEKNQTFCLSGFYHSRENTDPIPFRVEIPLKNRSEEAIVAAASQAIKQLAEQINHALTTSQGRN